MIFGKKRAQIRKLFQHPYRIVVFNDLNLHIIKQARFNARSLLMTLITAVIVIIVGVTVLIAFTPLREYIPGYTTGKIRQTLINNVLVVDSLEHEIQVRDKYYNDFKRMIMGEVTEADTAVIKTTPSSPGEVKFNKYNADSLFKDELAAERDAAHSISKAQKMSIADLQFTSPLKGVTTGVQELNRAHYGVDIVGKTNSRISAVLDGTIILAEWTVETGYVIEIQHENNLISIYKHNAELLKKQGEKVKAGEAIAIMGNTGKETTGPHLHFEMWMNGMALDPQQYIDF